MWLWFKPPSENLKKRLSACTEPAASNLLAEDVAWVWLRGNTVITGKCLMRDGLIICDMTKQKPRCVQHMAVAADPFVVIGLLSVAGKVMGRPVAMWLSICNKCLTGAGPRRRVAGAAR